jgi:hypothetical protein
MGAYDSNYFMPQSNPDSFMSDPSNGFNAATSAEAVSPVGGSVTAEAGVAALGIPILGWAVGAFQIGSALKQAQDIQNQAEVTNDLNQVNAKYYDIDADNAMKAGESQSSFYQGKIDQTIGGQEGAEAGENVKVGFGTAATLESQTKTSGFANQLDILAQARAQALGYTQQAQNTRTSGALTVAQGDVTSNATRNAGTLQGLTSGVRAWSTDPDNPNLGGNLGSSNYSRM